MPEISVVTSLFKSAPYIDEFYARCRAAIAPITDSYEFIFVDDGSPDDSKERICALIEKDSNVRLVELSRNFGHHKAVMAGLRYARGDYVLLLDSDLEEEPELLTQFYDVMTTDERKPDVVYGYMTHRKGRWIERVSGTLFYKTINFISEIYIPENALVARLMTQSYVRNLIRYDESHVFLGGVLQLTGYRQVGIPAKKGSKGSSTYTLGIKISQAMDAILSFTNKPLTYVAALGLGISGVSLLVALFFVMRVLASGRDLDTIGLILVSIWFLGGLTIFSIGLVGFYVGRIYSEVKDRPNVIIKQVHNEFDET